MGLLKDLNRHITENMARHGHYLTDPHAPDEERLSESVDLLMPFVRKDKREAVKRTVLDIIRANGVEQIRA